VPQSCHITGPGRSNAARLLVEESKVKRSQMNPVSRLALALTGALYAITCAHAAPVPPASPPPATPPAALEMLDPGFTPTDFGCVVRLRYLQLLARDNSEKASDAEKKAQSLDMSQRAHRGVYYYAARLLAAGKVEDRSKDGFTEFSALVDLPKDRQTRQILTCLKSAEDAERELDRSMRTRD
jgi:hypothetical protein